MRARSRTFQILSSVAGAACGFLPGLILFDSKTSDGHSKTPEAAESGLSAADRGALSKPDAAAAGAVFSAMQERNSLQRGREMQRAVDRLSADRVALFVKQVEARVDYETEPLLMALVKRWVLVAPEAAAVWMRPLLERQDANAGSSRDSAIMRAWCTSDPERAFAVVAERPDADTSVALTWGAMESICIRDPAAGI